MAKRMGLGKGLGALIADTSGEPEKTAEREKPKSREKEETGKELYLKVSSIEPNRMQPRKNFDEDALLELDDCLKAQGFRIGAGTALLAEHSMVRDVAAGRPDNQDRKEMADFGARILEKLEEEGWQEPQVPGNRPYRDWKQMPVIPLTNASCISCGLCAARCPVQAIPVSNPSSTDQARCILCMRCISVCPVKARSLPEQACAMLEQKLSPVRDIRRENELFL